MKGVINSTSVLMREIVATKAEKIYTLSCLFLREMSEVATEGLVTIGGKSVSVITGSKLIEMVGIYQRRSVYLVGLMNHQLHFQFEFNGNGITRCGHFLNSPCGSFPATS